MKRIWRGMAVIFLTVLLTSISGCGSKKAEITFVGMSETNVLTVQYTAKGNLSKDEAQLKITVSKDSGPVTGTVFSLQDMQTDLERGRKYLSLFDFDAEREWSVQGGVKLNGAMVSNSIRTSDILSLFGSGAKISAAFLVGGKTVSEMMLE